MICIRAVLVVVLLLADLPALAADRFAVFTYSNPVPAEYEKMLDPTLWVNGSLRWKLPEPFRSDNAWYIRAPSTAILKSTLDAMSRDHSKLIILDGEMFPFKRNADLLNRMIDLRDRNRPDAKITAYGFWPTEANRNEVIDEARASGENPSAQKRILGDDALQRFERRWDAVNVDCYLMGETYFDRDIQFIQASCALANRLDALRGKPILLTVRGCWPNANNDMVPIPQQQLAKYVETIRASAAGAIVFDPQPYDRQFISMLRADDPTTNATSAPVDPGSGNSTPVRPRLGDRVKVDGTSVNRGR